MSSPRDARDRQLRAALIALAITFALIDGYPAPAPGLKGPLVELGRKVDRVCGKLLAPVRPLMEAFNVTQRYRLFPGGEVHPLRMVIDARAATGPWRTLYAPLDPAHRFLGRALEYRRVRGSWDPTIRGPRGGYDEVVSWVATRAFADDPSLIEVRARMEVLTVAPRATSVTSEGRFVYERLRRRPR